MDNVSEKIDRWLGEHPQYAFLIFIGAFLFVLLGIIHYCPVKVDK